jgi:hypothetical protein
MTTPLTTLYKAGDRVTLITDLERDSVGPLPQPGDVGTIRAIDTSAPGDGDETFLVFDVDWHTATRSIVVGEDEIARLPLTPREQDLFSRALKVARDVRG